MIVDKILRQFIEVAMFKNVSHAANKLCLSQPTLTHNMKKLEENLGVQLLERTSTGLHHRIRRSAAGTGADDAAHL